MRRELRFGKETRRRSWDWVPGALKLCFQIGIVCFLAFVFVWYFGQKTSNIGDSMNPVLKNGDVVLVDRFRYDASSPRRGDIIVFKPNGNEHLHSYVKRIIGLPGETVQIKDGVIYINGKKLEEKYTTTEITDAGLAEEVVRLAGDEYFVLGDNRQVSSDDSRSADIGHVKRSEFEGKAWFILSPRSRIGRIK